eukprot:CAMPEP_0177273486 /NCGR_PEP_ID=MMETSP0367-20130122/66638_1 /TAXON_ID=447022 ORGANISM="Scrippsiella hangoei-like, Strain SHHI-4" /NCGR_SAMPLE_ID=MMETSP0367 /ASSEMBLY_ACC=CAM_ASM_000362 /LENGTH=67 /DNA_ID=CAMNT_0018729715 /DNA_START=20 /DNA_END=219 /DNA_ORIENTATION=-
MGSREDASTQRHTASPTSAISNVMRSFSKPSMSSSTSMALSKLSSSLAHIAAAAASQAPRSAFARLG